MILKKYENMVSSNMKEKEKNKITITIKKHDSNIK